MLVYDVGDRQSFNNITNWMSQITQHADVHVNNVLIGNKSDIDTRVCPPPYPNPLPPLASLHASLCDAGGQHRGRPRARGQVRHQVL